MQLRCAPLGRPVALLRPLFAQVHRTLQEDPALSKLQIAAADASAATAMSAAADDISA